MAPKAIAKRCGLGTAAAMRRVFMRELGVAPVDYRDKFHAPAAVSILRAAAASLVPAS